MSQGNAALYIVIGIVALSLAAVAITRINKEDNHDNKENVEVVTPEESTPEIETNYESTPNDIEAENPEEETPAGEAVSITQDRTVVENATSSGEHGTFMTAVQIARLNDTLNGDGPFTVFAPTDEAFSLLPNEAVSQLLNPQGKEELMRILTYHIVPGEYTLADLSDGLQLETVNGHVLVFNMVDGVWWINKSARITSPNVISSNGVFYSLDLVLLPSD